MSGDSDIDAVYYQALFRIAQVIERSKEEHPTSAALAILRLLGEQGWKIPGTK